MVSLSILNTKFIPMKKPVIFVLDDDTSVLRAVVRDLREAYKKEYRVMATESAAEALESLRVMKNKGEAVALFLSDQRMPEMLGVDFLEKARELYPDAKRILLTAYSDTDAAIRAINEVQLDYYLMKPWDPPEERLYPVLSDHLDEWQSSYRPEFQGIKIVGYQWSPRSHQIKDFLSGNLIPYQWLDMETNTDAGALIRSNQIDQKDLPAVFFEDGEVLASPDLQTVGQKMGMQGVAQQKMYDVTIIGAGPAGLAAAVYGGSEGLNTLLIEKRAPGGQAGTSSRIENYLGFPKGLSGAELSRRAITQATRFGIEFLSPQEVVDIELRDNYKLVKLANGNEINTKSIIITTGVDYRQLNAEGINDFTGAGVYYGAATTEANACKNEEVFIVGGGNSAGQAAMYLANYAKKVSVLVRKPDLKSSMSQYLIEQIHATENIEVLGHTEVVQAHGTDRLQELTLLNTESNEKTKVKAGALLIFIGAKPVTDWLGLNIVKDEQGFIVTGNALLKYKTFKKSWKYYRKPYLLETCSPGIFAAGDVRSGAMNRVASAVGEGSMTIKFIHEYLNEI